MEVPKLSSLCWDTFHRLSPSQNRIFLYRFLETKLEGGILSSPRSGTRITKLSSLCWEAFDQLTPLQKRECLHPYLQTREPIHRFSDIQRGDHLVRKGSTLMGRLLFEHHFLCIANNEEGKPVIVHYFVSMKDALWRMFDFLLGLGGSFAIVNGITLPHADFIKCEEDLQKQGEEVERVVWPEALRRYNVETVFWRAMWSVGEQRYHVTRNNCENFVLWCICGSNVSLQATPERRTAWETVTSLELFIPVRTFAVYWIITALKIRYAHKNIQIDWSVLRYMTSVVEFSQAYSEMKRCDKELME